MPSRSSTAATRSARTSARADGCCNGDVRLVRARRQPAVRVPARRVRSRPTARRAAISSTASTLLDELATRYPHLTRITTRVSPEEMTFDPHVRASTTARRRFGRLSLRGNQPSLAACTGGMLDKPRYADLDGAAGVRGDVLRHRRPVRDHRSTAPRARAARARSRSGSLDLDGAPSVTCVPETPTVDLRAGGEPLPDACADVELRRRHVHRSQRRRGLRVRDRAPPRWSAPRRRPRRAARRSSARATRRAPRTTATALRDLEVCAPPPPACGPDGWLVHTGSTRPGVACGDLDPPASAQRPGPKPTCGDLARVWWVSAERRPASRPSRWAGWSRSWSLRRRRRAEAR